MSTDLFEDMTSSLGRTNKKQNRPEDLESPTHASGYKFIICDNRKRTYKRFSASIPMKGINGENTYYRSKGYNTPVEAAADACNYMNSNSITIDGNGKLISIDEEARPEAEPESQVEPATLEVYGSNLATAAPAAFSDVRQKEISRHKQAGRIAETPTTSSGYFGVHIYRRANKFIGWRADVIKRSIKHRLPGYYKTEIEAALARARFLEEDEVAVVATEIMEDDDETMEVEVQVEDFVQETAGKRTPKASRLKRKRLSIGDDVHVPFNDGEWYTGRITGGSPLSWHVIFESQLEIDISGSDLKLHKENYEKWKRRKTNQESVPSSTISQCYPLVPYSPNISECASVAPSVPISTPESSSVAPFVPDSTPESSPASVPDSTLESSSASLPDSTPEPSIPDSIVPESSIDSIGGLADILDHLDESTCQKALSFCLDHDVRHVKFITEVGAEDDFLETLGVKGITLKALKKRLACV